MVAPPAKEASGRGTKRGVPPESTLGAFGRLLVAFVCGGGLLVVVLEWAWLADVRVTEWWKPQSMEDEQQEDGYALWGLNTVPNLAALRIMWR